MTSPSTRLPPKLRLPTLLTTIEWMRRPYPFLDECRAQYGDTFSMKLLALPTMVVFSNPEDVRQVFQDDGEMLAAGQFNRSLAPLLGDGSVLMADGRQHRRKRKLLHAPFHGERMHSYGAAMIEITDRALSHLPHSEPFSLHAVMQNITLEVIVRTVFGIEEGPSFDEMVRRTKRVLELGSWPPLLVPFMQHELGGRSPYGKFKKAIRAGDELIFAEIRRRRQTGERGDDILSLLLDAKDDAGAVADELELRDELVTLLVAGHETTATGLTWAVRWLLSQPGTFADLRAAIDALGPDPSADTIAKCELLDSAAREALRLVPVIPLVGRILARPMTLGGYDLPEGTAVIGSIYLAHRREQAFPHATEFQAKRFMGRKVSAYEFFPFGGGVRRCIGMAFALYEMKVVLARIFAKVNLVFAQDSFGMVRRSITITPEHGLMLKSSPRLPS